MCRRWECAGHTRLEGYTLFGLTLRARAAQVETDGAHVQSQLPRWPGTAAGRPAVDARCAGPHQTWANYCRPCYIQAPRCGHQGIWGSHFTPIYAEVAPRAEAGPATWMAKYLALGYCRLLLDCFRACRFAVAVLTLAIHLLYIGSCHYNTTPPWIAAFQTCPINLIAQPQKLLRPRRGPIHLRQRTLSSSR